MTNKATVCNWSLLFDIALSHGDSLREQRLRYLGFMTMLRSADILGPKTGVYEFLVESLWQLHGQPSPSSECSVSTKKAKTICDLTVDFEGFLAIMNVVCLRCYQTRRYSELLEEKCSTTDAILLSSEDKVKLRESVAFTARHFLKPFIGRCVVFKKMIVSLDSMKNTWTPYTNQFVTHVIASAAESTIFPLFYRYAEDGRLYRAGFEELVSDVFSHFTDTQKQGAVSVFEYRGFFGIHHLMEHCSLEVKESKTPALELDSFAEALLMLGIVAFSDEAMYVHYRPFTAKVWAVFEDYYTKFVGVKMIDDPIVENRFAFILPTISLVFPSRVPLDKVSSFIIGGWNLTVDRGEESSLDVDLDYPPRILNCDLVKSNFDGVEKRRVSGPRLLSTAEAASKLFDEGLCRSRSIERELPIYGMMRCTVYVDQYRAVTFQRGPNRVEVVIPQSIWEISIQKTRVHFLECGREGKLTLCPVTRVVVSLRDHCGDEVYSSKEVTFIASPLEEKLTELHMRELKAIFDLHSTNGVMFNDQFDSACVVLCVAQLALKWGGCSSFLRVYWERRHDEGLSEDENIRRTECSLLFTEFVSAVATLLLYQLGAIRCLPNVLYLLAVAMSRISQRLPPFNDPSNLSGIPLMPQPPPKLPCPYNARVDVPYTSTLRRRDTLLRFYSGAEEMLKTVGGYGSSVKLLPNFPVDAKTVTVVSQYGDGGNGLREKVKTTSELLRKTFLKKEMVVCRQGLKSD